MPAGAVEAADAAGRASGGEQREEAISAAKKCASNVEGVTKANRHRNITIPAPSA